MLTQTPSILIVTFPSSSVGLAGLLSNRSKRPGIVFWGVSEVLSTTEPAGSSSGRPLMNTVVGSGFTRTGRDSNRSKRFALKSGSSFDTGLRGFQEALYTMDESELLSPISLDFNTLRQ